MKEESTPAGKIWAVVQQEQSAIQTLVDRNLNEWTKMLTDVYNNVSADALPGFSGGDERGWVGWNTLQKIREEEKTKEAIEKDISVFTKGLPKPFRMPCPFKFNSR